MKNSIKSLLTITALATAAAASAADFSGSWVRDGAKSDVVPNPMYWLVRGVDAGGSRGRDTAIVIEVKHDATGMKVTDPAKPLRSYVLDAKPRTVTTDAGLEKATVTARLQGEILTIESEQPFSGLPGSATLKVKETWQLSPDGKQLTILTLRETPAKQQTYSEVFNRR